MALVMTGTHLSRSFRFEIAPSLELLSFVRYGRRQTVRNGLGLRDLRQSYDVVQIASEVGAQPNMINCARIWSTSYGLSDEWSTTDRA
jgi:hypothetical protein